MTRRGEAPASSRCGVGAAGLHFEHPVERGLVTRLDRNGTFDLRDRSAAQATGSDADLTLAASTMMT
jgi:hypothetical protein